VDNQHRKIKGCRELTQKEIDGMNEIKELAAKVGDLVEKLEGCTFGNEIDGRWCAIGKTNLQQGFMALTRAVAKPGFF